MLSVSDTYLSVAGESTGIYREKASKFIGISLPANSEEEIRGKLSNIRKDFYDANHHCYAYRLGPEKVIYRSNDDGEPSGSAGKPILGQILSKDLSDILIVVVRYFGGTKLGIPGLIHAYRTAAREAVESGEIIEKKVTLEFIIRFEYQVMNEVMRILKDESAHITGQSFDQECKLEFAIRKSMAGRVSERLTRLNHVSVHNKC